MTRDIFAAKYPNVASVRDIPHDFEPPVIGARDEVIGKILDVAKDADFSDPGWGIIQRGPCTIEVNLGEDDPVVDIAFHITGENGGFECVVDILKQLGLRGIDSESGEFLDLKSPRPPAHGRKATRDSLLDEFLDADLEETEDDDWLEPLPPLSEEEEEDDDDGDQAGEEAKK